MFLLPFPPISQTDVSIALQPGCRIVPSARPGQNGMKLQFQPRIRTIRWSTQKYKTADLVEQDSNSWTKIVCFLFVVIEFLSIKFCSWTLQVIFVLAKMCQLYAEDPCMLRNCGISTSQNSMLSWQKKRFFACMQRERHRFCSSAWGEVLQVLRHRSNGKEVNPSPQGTYCSALGLF